jgi:hypothetical protein
VKAEGGIGIETASEEMGGDRIAWHNEKRVILFHEQDMIEDKLSLAEKINGLVFELCNASRTKIFAFLANQAREKKFDINSYVERVEKMEFMTSCQRWQIIAEGVKSGTIPKDDYYKSPDSEDFNEYYAEQQVGGHSQRIAERYQSLFPKETHLYTGTVCHLSKSNMKTLLGFLGGNSGIKPSNPEWDKCVTIASDTLRAMQLSTDPEDRALLEAARKIFTKPGGLVATALKAL